MNEPTPVTVRLSRRRFLRGSGAAVVAGGLATTLAACESDAPQGPLAATPEHVEQPTGFRYGRVPATPTSALDTQVRQFFNDHEARTLDALVSRILPGTPADPGAHEAGVVDYIDYKLGTTEGGFATGIYTQPPFAEVYHGDTPPPDDGRAVYVNAEQLERYGYQSSATYREIFRTGLASLDAFANSIAGHDFLALGDTDQDGIIDALADGTASGFGDPSAALFFTTVRDHVTEGFFCDPVYGGNRDMVGWRLIGFAGAQRAYTEADIRGHTPMRSPQSIADLHMFHAGTANGDPNAVLPVSGSDHRGGH